jgi:hypothetical protein
MTSSFCALRRAGRPQLLHDPHDVADVGVSVWVGHRDFAETESIIPGLGPRAAGWGSIAEAGCGCSTSRRAYASFGAVHLTRPDRASSGQPALPARKQSKRHERCRPSSYSTKRNIIGNCVDKSADNYF